MEKIETQTKKVSMHPIGHDSSICMIDHDKKEVFAISTERATRFKHDYRFVAPLIEQYCKLDKDTKIIIPFNDVNADRIKYGEVRHDLDIILKKYKKIMSGGSTKYRKLALLFLKSPMDFIRAAKLKRSLNRFSFKRDMAGFANYLSRRYGVTKENVRFYDHHFSHACSAYYSSPEDFKDNCLVLTLDGQGDGAFSKLFIIKDNKPVEVASSPDCASIPLLYSIFTLVAGFSPNADEGKVEALACYGNISKENPLYRVLNGAFSWDSNLNIYIKKKNRDFPFYSINEQWGKIEIFLRDWKKKIGDKDFSAAIQLFFEEFFLEYFKAIKEKYPFENIAFAGGGFANVKLNLRIIEDKVFKNVYIFPAMGDDGTTFGAHVYDDIKEGRDVEWIRKQIMPFWGPEYSSEQIRRTLAENNNKINYRYLGESSYKDLARDIAANKLCALFAGKMEYGPRALGHRSILANPRNPLIREAINIKFKKREWFQPFCPSILESERKRLFAISYPNKHMTCAFTIRKEFSDELPAIIHIDHTARPQFVEKTDDKYYFNLLTELKKINKYGAVLNTSFNIHGKTIVLTPQDALDDFFACGIDALYIGGFKVTRK